MVHENAPRPEPDVHVELAVVGLGDVLQQIPREVTEKVPWLVTLPFPVALENVMPETELVVTLAGTEAVVKLVWEP